MGIVDGIEKCPILIKNTDQVTNQVEIKNWDYYNMKAKV